MEKKERKNLNEEVVVPSDSLIFLGIVLAFKRYKTQYFKERKEVRFSGKAVKDITLIQNTSF